MKGASGNKDVGCPSIVVSKTTLNLDTYLQLYYHAGVYQGSYALYQSMLCAKPVQVFCAEPPPNRGTSRKYRYDGVYVMKKVTDNDMNVLDSFNNTGEATHGKCSMKEAHYFLLEKKQYIMC